MLSSIVLVGVGCTNAPVSNLTPEQASNELSLEQGSEIVLRPTVLGVGGRIVRLLGGEMDERVISISEWVPGQSVALGWTVTTQKETAASVAAREAYDAQYAQSPVGVEVPDQPKHVYEDVTRAGSISSSVLDDATTIGLPELWSDGDGGNVETSLLWLSKAQYNELANTRSTRLSLGLFDESLMEVEEVVTRLGSFVSKIAAILPLSKGEIEGVASESEADTVSLHGLLTITADPSWHSYALTVDGVHTTVQTIEAENKFANLTILANQDNPLILEIRLTPLARGSIDVLSVDGLSEGFGGYEIVSIETKK